MPMVRESITTTDCFSSAANVPIGVGYLGLPIDAGICAHHLVVDADGEGMRVDVGDTHHRGARLKRRLRTTRRHDDARVSGPESLRIPLHDTVIEPRERTRRCGGRGDRDGALGGGAVDDRLRERHGHRHRDTHLLAGRRLDAHNVGRRDDAGRTGCDGSRGRDHCNAHHDKHITNGATHSLHSSEMGGQHTFILVRKRRIPG